MALRVLSKIGDAIVVKDWLGHRDIRSTMEYAQICKRVAQPELQNPRIARAGNSPEECGAERSGGVAEVHAVERIEELRPEFDLVRLRIRHREVLEQRQIQIHERGS